MNIPEGLSPSAIPAPDTIVYYGAGVFAPMMFHFATEGCDRLLDECRIERNFLQKLCADRADALSRAKGFDLQATSHAANGLPAVNCSRPGGYGNPFVIGEEPGNYLSHYHCGGVVENAEQAVEAYRKLLLRNLSKNDRCIDALLKLRGQNLACWCAIGSPCHADVLLEWANKGQNP